MQSFSADSYFSSSNVPQWAVPAQSLLRLRLTFWNLELLRKRYKGRGEVKQGFPKDDFLSKLRCVMMNDRLPLNVQTFEGFITSSFVVKLRCERISSESLKKLRHRRILGATIVCMCRTRPMLHDCFLHSTQSGTARLLRFNIISIFKTFL